MRDLNISEMEFVAGGFDLEVGISIFDKKPTSPNTPEYKQPSPGQQPEERDNDKLFPTFVGDFFGGLVQAGCMIGSRGKAVVGCTAAGVLVQEAVNNIPNDVGNGPTNAWLTAKTGEPLNYPEPRN